MTDNIKEIESLANRNAILRLIGRHRTEFESYVLEERALADAAGLPTVEWLAFLDEDYT